MELELCSNDSSLGGGCLCLVFLGVVFGESETKKQHFIVVYWFCMCKRNGESVIFFIVGLLVVCGMFSLVDLCCLGMPRQVVDLYACWSTTGNTQSAIVIPSCLL
jgi:hypothetical protein